MTRLAWLIELARLFLVGLGRFRRQVEFTFNDNVQSLPVAVDIVLVERTTAPAVQV